MHSQSAYPNALTPLFCVRSLAPSHSPCGIACAGPNHIASPHIPNPEENVHSPYLVCHDGLSPRSCLPISFLYTYLFPTLPQESPPLPFTYITHPLLHSCRLHSSYVHCALLLAYYY